MEQRPRKVRGSSQSTNRSPSLNKLPMRGAYTNEALVFEVANLLGCVVEATTREGVVYEGVLISVSPDSDIALELAHVKSKKLSRDNVHKSLQLKFCDIITIVAKVTTNPSMEQKEGLKLDRDISSGAGSSADRELQPFTDFEESENVAMTMGLDGSGWRPEEMWRENEEKFNVQSTYDESLIQYTTPLERTDTEEFRQKEARAERLASEIENKYDWPSLNDGTEEEKFSAVVDPLTYVNTTSSSSGTSSKPVDLSIDKTMSATYTGATGTELQHNQPVEPVSATTDVVTGSNGLPDQPVNDENSVHGEDEAKGHKTKEETIKAFQLNPSAKEFTPSVPTAPLELLSPSATQTPIVSPPSQSPQAIYSPNKGRFPNFQKPRPPRAFISPDPVLPATPTGYIYPSPSVALSPQPLARQFVPGSMVMPGAPYGLLSPQQQIMPGFPPQVLTMGQVATQPPHYVGPLGQPGQPFSVAPQMLQANQHMFYMPAMQQQGTVPNFVPAQPVMPSAQQFLMLPRK